jgi:AraC family cel operon transcriptional repressor
MAPQLRLGEVCPNQEPFHIADTPLPGHYRTFAHSHDFYEFFVVRRGVVRHFVNGAHEDMPVGALTLVRPRDEHCFQNAGGTGASVFTNVAFGARTYDQVVAALPLGLARRTQSLPPLLPGLAEPRRRHVDALIGQLRSDTSLAPVEQSLLLCDLLTAVLTALVLSERSSAQTQQAAPDWLQSAVASMTQRDNYCAGLPRLLALCGHSQEHVTRSMRRFVGVTPTAFVNRLRLAEAARLLCNTDRKVLPILLDCGFNNVSHFLALFRERYNCTPRQYRRRHRMVTDPVSIADVNR